MSKVVRIRERTAERLRALQAPGETPDAVLRRLLGLPAREPHHYRFKPGHPYYPKKHRV